MEEDNKYLKFYVRYSSYFYLVLIILLFTNWNSILYRLIFIFAIIVLAIIDITINWENYMFYIKYIETMVWGKPLDPDLWKGKKIPKVKFVWGKKKEAKKDD